MEKFVLERHVWLLVVGCLLIIAKLAVINVFCLFEQELHCVHIMISVSLFVGICTCFYACGHPMDWAGRIMFTVVHLCVFGYTSCVFAYQIIGIV